ncbi:putative fucosyltransferase-like protein [Turnera subulata]|uniref:Fucosyltransferase n=1 Tax=Turnera subulata TaxID=218843 RepID=A0A9Q0FT51_9ROSI|nr:putative fucosyltransferase-like protein [Turnera subulata]
MGSLSNLRGSKSAATSTQEGLPSSFDGLPSYSSPASSSSSSSSQAASGFKMKWSNFLPIFVALVVVAEIAFLGRLDMAKNAAILDSWADSLFERPFAAPAVIERGKLGAQSWGFAEKDRNLEAESCEEWLEKEDALTYSRDFDKDPVLVTGAEEESRSCSVGCRFGFDPNRNPDAAFGLAQQTATASVLRSMESAQYYAENNIEQARRWEPAFSFNFGNRGYNIVMTTSLSSDVPVGYFSWAEYDLMAPVQPKTEKALAAAFISNCGARNFRLQALEGLEKSDIKIDSYGGCHRNRDGRVDKVETLKRYKFSLAFENSNEEDYVTEKFFQSLVAGTIPVVVGAPNIQDFAPASDSILHIKQIKDVGSVAKTMKYLAENPDAYNHSLRWKYEGPSDSFKALVDMSAAHSSCRLCIHLATAIREKEEKAPGIKKRPCKCTRGSDTVYHIYVRERGRFEMESIFLRSTNLTRTALESEVLKKFKSVNHVPIWKPERPESIRGGDEYKVYRIYPVGMTQRQALYKFRFKTDADFKNHMETNPCAKLEVIFV